MTNAEIIRKELAANLTPAQIHEIAAHVASAEKIAALAAGITATDKDGNAVNTALNAEIAIAAGAVHTYHAWREEGLQVRRGEKALFSCYLWRWTDKPSKARQAEAAKAAANGDDSPAADPHYYKALAHLFSALQVGKSEPVHVKTREEIAAYNAKLAAERRAAKAAQQAAAATTAPAAPTVPECAPATTPRKPAVVAVVEHHNINGAETTEPQQLDFASIAASVLA